MANIDLVPEFWEEFKRSGRVISSKRAMLEYFAEWLDLRHQKEFKPKVYTQPVQSVRVIHKE